MNEAMWVKLEMMGHRVEYGRAEEVTIAGAPFLRLEVYVDDAAEPTAVKFVPPGSIYCITLTTEEAARARWAGAGELLPIHSGPAGPLLPSHTYDDPPRPGTFEGAGSAFADEDPPF